MIANTWWGSGQEGYSCLQSCNVNLNRPLTKQWMGFPPQNGFLSGSSKLTCILGKYLLWLPLPPIMFALKTNNKKSLPLLDISNQCESCFYLLSFLNFLYFTFFFFRCLIFFLQTILKVSWQQQEGKVCRDKTEDTFTKNHCWIQDRR